MTYMASFSVTLIGVSLNSWSLFMDGLIQNKTTKDRHPNKTSVH